MLLLCIICPSSDQTLDVCFAVFFADVKRRKVDLPSGSKVSIESFWWVADEGGRAALQRSVSNSTFGTVSSANPADALFH